MDILFFFFFFKLQESDEVDLLMLMINCHLGIKV